MSVKYELGNKHKQRANILQTFKDNGRRYKIIGLGTVLNQFYANKYRSNRFPRSFTNLIKKLYKFPR